MTNPVPPHGCVSGPKGCPTCYPERYPAQEKLFRDVPPLVFGRFEVEPMVRWCPSCGNTPHLHLEDGPPQVSCQMARCGNFGIRFGLEYWDSLPRPTTGPGSLTLLQSPPESSLFARLRMTEQALDRANKLIAAQADENDRTCRNLQAQLEGAKGMSGRVDEQVKDFPVCDWCKERPSEYVHPKAGWGTLSPPEHLCDPCVKKTMSWFSYWAGRIFSGRFW